MPLSFVRRHELQRTLSVVRANDKAQIRTRPSMEERAGREYQSPAFSFVGQRPTPDAMGGGRLAARRLFDVVWHCVVGIALFAISADVVWTVSRLMELTQ